MSQPLSHLHKLKEKLPHTWSAFLARFGRFTDIQALAVIDWFEGYTEVVPGIPGRTYCQLLTYQRSSRVNRAPIGVGFSSVLACTVAGSI